MRYAADPGLDVDRFRRSRIRRTVDLGRDEDCLKLLSMRASFNASLAPRLTPAMRAGSRKD